MLDVIDVITQWPQSLVVSLWIGGVAVILVDRWFDQHFPNSD